MRRFFIFLSLVSCFSATAQDTSLHQPRPSVKTNNRHIFEISPASLWLNPNIFVGHRLKYRLQFKRSMGIELESNGTLFRGLDYHAKMLKEAKVFPLLNQSTAIYDMNIFGKGKTITRDKQKRFIGNLRLGYHFFQHSTPYWNREYWAYDSTLQEGYSSIRSFQSHSISAGLGFQVQKYKRLDGKIRQVAAHKWTLDYLGCVHYQLSSYSTNDADQYNIRNIPNAYTLRKSGARFSYNYTRFLNTYFGLHFGVETVYIPFITDYKPLTSPFFVPRGGERLVPFFTNIHVGVVFAF
jgi:hypothetical protein